jgi:putative (di)nucleoside polyphosphate hydrolase
VTGYRPCAGILLLDRRGRAFAGRRNDVAGAAWQFPQGGMDEGEEVRAAALRELEEETGIAASLVRVERVAPEPARYDIPEALRPSHWAGRWRGQAVTWVLMRFLGTDADVGVATAHPEFAEWRWADPAEIAAGIIPWKRDAYAAALALIAQSPRLG